jgi:hypothetical protein
VKSEGADLKQKLEAGMSRAAPEKKPCRIWIVVMDDVAVAVTGRTLRLPRDRIGRSILKHVSYDVLFDWSLQPMF